MLSDDELLAFDTDELEDFDDDSARELLAGEHAQLYRNHLVIARAADDWQAQLVEATRGMRIDRSHQEGFFQALTEVAQLLRLGEFLPGGASYQDAIGEPLQEEPAQAEEAAATAGPWEEG